MGLTGFELQEYSGLHIRVRQLDHSKVVLAESPHLHRLHYLLGPLSGTKAFSSESQNLLPVLNWIRFYLYSTQWQQQPPQGTKIKNLYRLQWFRKMLMFIFPATRATLHQMNQKSSVTGTRGLWSTKYEKWQSEYYTWWFISSDLVKGNVSVNISTCVPVQGCVGPAQLVMTVLVSLSASSDNNTARSQMSWCCNSEPFVFSSRPLTSRHTDTSSLITPHTHLSTTCRQKAQTYSEVSLSYLDMHHRKVQFLSQLKRPCVTFGLDASACCHVVMLHGRSNFHAAHIHLRW